MLYRGGISDDEMNRQVICSGMKGFNGLALNPRTSA